jgi:hypothetical protein
MKWYYIQEDGLLREECEYSKEDCTGCHRYCICDEVDKFEAAVTKYYPLFEAKPGDRFEEEQLDFGWAYLGTLSWIMCDEDEAKEAKKNKIEVHQTATLKPGLDLNKLDREVDDLIANQTAESYNKTFAEIDREVVEEPKQEAEIKITSVSEAILTLPITNDTITVETTKESVLIRIPVGKKVTIEPIKKPIERYYE